MVDIDRLFPIDPEITEEVIELELGRPDHLRRNVTLAGAAISALVAIEVLRRFKPFTGIDTDQS